MPTALSEPGLGVGLGVGRQEWSQVGQRRTGYLGVEAVVGTIGDLQSSVEDWGLRSGTVKGYDENGGPPRDCRGKTLGRLEAEQTGLT